MEDIPSGYITAQIKPGYDKNLGHIQANLDLQNHHPIDVKKSEVQFFKRHVDPAEFFKFLSDKGHVKNLRRITGVDDRFDYFRGLVEDFYNKMGVRDVDFGFYLVNRFQKEFPDISLGMCKELSIDLGKLGMVKTCSKSGLEEKVYCTGFNPKRGVDCSYHW